MVKVYYLIDRVGLWLVEPTARRGTEAQGTHLREGEAGHNVLPKGTTGGTSRPQTVSSKLRESAE